MFSKNSSVLDLTPFHVDPDHKCLLECIIILIVLPLVFLLFKFASEMDEDMDYSEDSCDMSQ